MALVISAHLHMKGAWPEGKQLKRVELINVGVLPCRIREDQNGPSSGSESWGFQRQVGIVKIFVWSLTA